MQIVKLWFHLSADAQRRAPSALSSPETSWQVAPADLKVFKKYNRLRNGGQIVINHTDCGHAPWVVIPSADEQMRAARTEAVLAAMRQRSVPRIPPGFVAHSGPARIVDRLGQLDYEARIDREDYESELGLLQGRLAAPRVRRNSRTARWCWCSKARTPPARRRDPRVTHALDARQFDITPVAAPNSYELSRPYLWRFWRQLPRRGRIAIFDRSWYGRVLVERVEKLARPTGVAPMPRSTTSRNNCRAAARWC